MKTWKKIVFNILGCILFFFIGSIALGIIIGDSELARSICFKIILGYVFILSFISCRKKEKETRLNLKKEDVKIIFKIVFSILRLLLILPYIILWGILATLAFTKFSKIVFTITFIVLAIYLLLVSIMTAIMNYVEYKEGDKKEVENLEKYVKNKKQE